MAKKSTPAAEPAASTEITLRTVAQDMKLWADTLEGLDDGPEKEEALALAARCIYDGATKVESFVAFVRQAEAQAAFYKAEADRIAKHGKVLSNTAERLRNYAKSSMFEAGRKQLKGHTSTITISSTGRSSVKIEDADAIPTAYKLLTIGMRSDDFDTLVRAAFPALEDDVLAAQVKSFVLSVETSYDAAAIKGAIEAGVEVPGADLDASGTKLVIS